MVSNIVVEDAARTLAEFRVPGSTLAGGQYHLSEAWRTMLLRNVRATIADAEAALLFKSGAPRAIASLPAQP